MNINGIAQNEWEEVGSITTEQSQLGATAKTDAAVEALATARRAIYELTEGWPNLAFRFRADGNNNDTNVIELYVEAGADHYRHVATLTLLQGEQEHSSGIYFCDSIVESVASWPTDREITQPQTPNNSISEYWINPLGHTKFLFISSTLNATTLYVDVRKG